MLDYSGAINAYAINAAAFNIDASIDWPGAGNAGLSVLADGRGVLELYPLGLAVQQVAASGLAVLGLAAQGAATVSFTGDGLALFDVEASGQADCIVQAVGVALAELYPQGSADVLVLVDGSGRLYTVAPAERRLTAPGRADSFLVQQASRVFVVPEKLREFRPGKQNRRLDA
jgi:hypothetical protein